MSLKNMKLMYSVLDIAISSFDNRFVKHKKRFQDMSLLNPSYFRKLNETNNIRFNKNFPSIQRFLPPECTEENLVNNTKT